jgi:hypothetical protein
MNIEKEELIQGYKDKLFVKYLNPLMNMDPDSLEFKIGYKDKNRLSGLFFLKKFQRTYFLKICYNKYFEIRIPIDAKEKNELKRILPMLKKDGELKKTYAEKFFKHY